MWVIGYGSLMNKDEFQSKNFKLVRVKGWGRIFNRINLRSAWEKYGKGNKIGTLNVVKSPGLYFNALAYKVSDKDFQKLIEREVDYHTEKAEAYDFETNEKVEEVTFFVSNKKTKDGKQILRENIMPNPKYLEVCRRGAYSWGDNFGKEFDKSTFLADGKTSIEAYIKSN